MPPQYSPEFRQRALRLLDTTMEASEVSEFEAIKSVAGKLVFRRSRCAGGDVGLKLMPVSVPVRPAPSMPRSVVSSVRSPTYAERMRF